MDIDKYQAPVRVGYNIMKMSQSFVKTLLHDDEQKLLLREPQCNNLAMVTGELWDDRIELFTLQLASS